MGEDIRKKVSERYGRIAKNSGSCCGPKKSSCGCGAPSAKEMSQGIGYSAEELQAVPQEANLGLGCGNPVAIASLKEGETVLDLGAGAGIDCFLASGKVGEKGQIIGVDMTLDMIHLARENASKNNFNNIEFRLGEIESLPVADSSVDVVISNCVINLSPQKDRVFREIYRVLKPGGRMMVSDIILNEELPASIRQSVAAYAGCIAGAISREEYIRLIEQAGLTQVKIMEEIKVPADLWTGDFLARSEEAIQASPADIRQALGAISSIKICAQKN